MHACYRKTGNDGKQETEKTKQTSIPPIHKTQIVTISDLPVKAQLLNACMHSLLVRFLKGVKNEE